MASNLVLLRHRVIWPVLIGLGVCVCACLGLRQWVWALSLALGGICGAVGFWVFVRAQETVVAQRHYGRFFAYFLARLVVYAFPIGYAAASPMMSMPITLLGLFSYNAYLIAVLIVKARRSL